MRCGVLPQEVANVIRDALTVLFKGTLSCVKQVELQVAEVRTTDVPANAAETAEDTREDKAWLAHSD